MKGFVDNITVYYYKSNQHSLISIKEVASGYDWLLAIYRMGRKQGPCEIYLQGSWLPVLSMLLINMTHVITVEKKFLQHNLINKINIRNGIPKWWMTGFEIKLWIRSLVSSSTYFVILGHRWIRLFQLLSVSIISLRPYWNTTLMVGWIDTRAYF